MRMLREESRAISYEYIGGKNVMPIMGFLGPEVTWHTPEQYPFPDRIQDYYYKMIAECGINVINYTNMDYAEVPELVKKAMDYCEKYHMGYYVLDSRVSSDAGRGADDEVNASELAGYLADYENHPAYCGIFLIDEPRTSYYLPGREGRKDPERYRDIAKVLQYELGQCCYINAFPIWDMETQGDVYEKYIAEYCETLCPKYLMWDHYPYYPNRECERLPIYFYNMDLIRTYAAKYEIPFWAAIQAGSQWNDEKAPIDSELPYFPNEEQFQWNINTCLAFGVQGITYFPLTQPEHYAWAGTDENLAWDFKRNGIIGASGEKNQWWYYAKRINKHICAIDEVLMNSVHKGILISGDKMREDMQYVTCVLETGSFEELNCVQGNAMVGCFDYQGKTALYVVNYSEKSAETIALEFNDEHKITIVQEAETSSAKTRQLQLDMKAGEGILLVVE